MRPLRVCLGHTLRSPVELVWKALYYAFMFSEDLMAQIINASPKAAYPSINMEDIRNFRLGVPPISEQRQMISELEALESRIESARAIIDDAPAAREAVLRKHLGM